MHRCFFRKLVEIIEMKYLQTEREVFERKQIKERHVHFNHFQGSKMVN